MQFKYTGINNKGKNISGTAEANSPEEAIVKLRSQGIYVTDVRETKTAPIKREIQLLTKVKTEDMVVFTRQLATLIRAGVTIIDAIDILSKQTENRGFAKVLAKVADAIRGGESLSDALAAYPKIFPKIVLSMIAAGEMSGTLEPTLETVAAYLEKQHQTKRKISSALTYPIVVMIMAVFVTIFLLINVVPSFTEMYASFDAELPLPTKIIMSLSDFTQKYWLALVAIVFVLILIYNLVTRNPKTKYYTDYFKLKLPIFGVLLQKSAIAKFARTLGLQLTSAIPILESLEMVSKVVGNEAIAKPIRESGNSLRQGTPLHKPLEKNKLFPPLLIHMMAIGDETGSLDEMLNKVADFYEADVDNMTDQLKQLIEPLLIVFLTVVVGTIVLAVIMPMFGVYDLIGGGGF